MKKKILLLILLPIVFLTLPTTCNAEEVPTLKWEDITTNFNDGMYLGDKQYNINNDILLVHNSSLMNDNYIRLYNSSGEKKWEYDLGDEHQNYFLINNEYLWRKQLFDPQNETWHEGFNAQQACPSKVYSSIF